jgi:hypothetical protein
VNPRAVRSPLEEALDWTTLVSRGGHCGVGRALCVRLSERCFVLVFLQVLSSIPLVVLGDPQGCPDTFRSTRVARCDAKDSIP